MEKLANITAQEALDYHAYPVPGKIDISSPKTLATLRDLALAYSPGVAEPVKKIAEDPLQAYRYTSKGNLVAIISNGTAILGLGNLGALASKPVMEGKSNLFKMFSNINAIDIELDTEDPEDFIRAVKLMEPTFGAIKLEDIKAPECFIIEERLRDELDIPVFHDDQHGTAVICAAGLINALKLVDKKIEDCKIVMNGAGAAGIACIDLIKSLGAKPENCIVCDSRGVISRNRKEGMNRWKERHAVETELVTLTDALSGADVFLGVSVKGALTEKMLRSMARDPIIFAMANPDPEITPEEAKRIRDDVIIATGRSDYPNQINNVLCFPYIFRGALDIRARKINEEMKLACAMALAETARLEIPEEVKRHYKKPIEFGPQYIIPSPLDNRLLHIIPPKVAEAGISSGIARVPEFDIDHYCETLRRIYPERD